MWILLGIAAFLWILITIILLLPIHVILRTDEQGAWQLRYTFLWKTFGEHPNPNHPITKALKRITGVTRLETDALKERIADGDLLATVSESVSVITDLLGHILDLLKVGTLKTLHVTIVCATGDAATTAIRYGAYYAAISPLLALLHSHIRIKRSGERICITPDFTAERDNYACKLVIQVRMFHALIALYRASKDEKERELTDKPKNPA